MASMLGVFLCNLDLESWREILPIFVCFAINLGLEYPHSTTHPEAAIC